MDPRIMNGPRVLAMISCDLCQRKEVPPHEEHLGSGCDVWRVFQPFEELQRQGYGKLNHWEQSGAEWVWAQENLIDQVAHEMLTFTYDAIILPRMVWQGEQRWQARAYIDRMHAANIAVIYETDDDIYSSNIIWRLKKTLHKDVAEDQLETRRLERLATLRLCDGVTVSSRRLATTMRALVDVPVIVVPNAIDVRWFRGAVRRTDRAVPGLTIGWAGGARPEDDLEPTFWAWGQIAQTYPDVTFVVAGHQPDSLSTYVPAHRVRRLPWVEPALYPMHYRQIDIGCAAVTDHPFNRCKTPIKIWEYALGGAPAVATPTLYGQTIEDGVDGLLAETPDQWLAALRRLVESKPLRRELRAAQLHRIRQNHSLADQAWRWPAAWTTIVNDFRNRQSYAARGLVLAGRSA